MRKDSIAEINRLINIQTHLEKSVGQVLKTIKHVEDIGETVIVLENTSELEQEYVQKAFQDIMESIKSKKKKLTQKKYYENTDLRLLKNEMINLQNNIQDLKKHIKMKLSSLEYDVQSFEEDVNLYSEKMDDWCKKVEINQYESVRSYKQNTSFPKHNVKEVQHFMDFMQKSNGHENAWRKDDHQMFIKFYKKYSNAETLVLRLNAVLPDHSIEDIKIHINWYKEYMLLKKQKENAIAKWKQSKKAGKLKYIDSEGAISLKILPHASSSYVIKEMLQDYKIEKEKHLLSATNKEEEKELRKKEKELLWKTRNKQLKSLVHEWKTTKLKMEEQQLNRKKTNEEKEQKERATEANKLIKQFRSQDDMYIMKRKEYKKRQKVRILVRSKSSNSGPRNPDRLLKPTEQWINRIHDDTAYLNNSFSALQVKTLPKLGIPEWRKTIGNKC